MKLSYIPIVASLALLSVVVGCESSHYGSKDDPHEAAIKVPSIDKSYELQARGKPPLNIVVVHGGSIKVVDLTEGELIHTAQVPAVNGGLVIELDPNKKALTYRNTSDKSQEPEIMLPIEPDHKFELYYQR